MLHGALGSGEQLRPLAGSLGAGRQVFAPDLPGHGRNAGSEDPGAFTIARFAEDTLAFLDQEGIDRADIFGYSMGGYVGLHLARHHPGRIRRIMTLGTKFDWTPATGEKEAARLDPEKLESKAPAFAAQLRERHGERWTQVLKATATMMLGLGASPDLSEADFASIPHPALIAVGDRDALVPLDETARTARALPAGACLVLPGTPHPLEQADRELLTYHLRRFFSPTGAE